ncbi:MAG: MerR family transcriptional regulator [Bacteroidia bacterium]|nr:MerR family transcriptional regulator [Bacteroidota bacterium]MBK8414640.1 MerR family transcriptional regulator [Bacteroidota bacterium]MBP9082544.1 MerR family transcriptional regulator [Bacteroidia bacterium]
MNHFSIKDIENLTGIKSHTLRIWEQRYGIPSPKRTETNIRYYDDEDLKLLLNVSMLNKQGHKISQLTSLSKAELENMALTYSEDVTDEGIQLDTMLAAMFNLDETAFEKILSSHLLKFGLEYTMTHLFFPFLKRIGVLWQTGQVNPAFEHFMSNLIRQKLIVAIDAQVYSVKPESKKFILFLPEGEMHEIGLLFANFVLRARGHQTIYLGQNLPYTDLDAIISQYKANYVMAVLTSIPSKSGIQDLINSLATRYPNQTMLLSGMQVANQISLKLPANVKVLNSIEGLTTLAEEA